MTGLPDASVAELPDAAVAELGAALHAARRSGVPIEPLTDAHRAMSMRDAYRVQRDLLARLLADGDRVVGYKLGLTSTPMQRIFGVDSPDFAPVLASDVRHDGARVAASGWPASMATSPASITRAVGCILASITRAVGCILAFPRRGLVR